MWFVKVISYLYERSACKISKISYIKDQESTCYRVQKHNITGQINNSARSNKELTGTAATFYEVFSEPIPLH